ncbi:protease complex subunit PrcB family protein [Anoxybacillus sp. ST4]|uniref:protease complex subunit PrcB family protein n=1 Tax=Anoxybacillus sp. ST4 TaxID=2864181 RepID=UPI002102A9EF|nr:protease complex subunit PrcB family protein [Anoxybacillus sp. ST4]
MKRWIVVLIGLFLSACSVSKAEETYEESENVVYHVVTEEQLPQHVKALYDRQHKQFKTYTVQQDGVMYIVTHLGERRTGGYDVVITNVTYEKGKIVVYYEERKPAPDAIVTQALTYPKIAIKIETTIPVEVKKK